MTNGAGDATSADDAAALVARLGTVGIVGAGLIGTSIGMALTAAGVDVLLRDRDPEQARVAVARRAGQPWPAGERVQHAVLAVPPHAVAEVLAAVQGADAAQTCSDVASVKAQIVSEARALGCDLASFCPAHPIAGRERGGAVSAQVDLFRDRMWVLCPVAETGDAARAASAAIAVLCGASVAVLDPVRHDELMARLSHLPQVVSSALAAQATSGLQDGDLVLAGSGLRDTTRLADSDGSLWASILEGNRLPVADGIDRLVEVLSDLARTLREGTVDDVTGAVEDLLVTGRSGRRKLPAKVGQPEPLWSWVGVVVPDRPGELARLFDLVGAWGVNVEDVRVEHSREQLRGVLELAVQPEAAQSLTERLQESGWRAYQRE